ncbi:MAG: extracellular solute-binding protein [Hungatella sp.]
MKKVFAIALTVAMMTGSLAGCGSSNTVSSEGSTVETESTTAGSTTAGTTTAAAQKEPVTLTYYTRSTAYPQRAEEINAKLHETLPNITLDIVHVADNYDTVVKTKFATGEPPELVEWYFYETNRPFVEAGYFADITEDHIVDHVKPQFQASGSLDGKVYGIPLLAAAGGMIYNTECFEKAGIAKVPSTFDELKDACEKLKAVGITPFATGYKDVWVANQTTWKFLAPYVGDLQIWADGMAKGTASFKTEDSDKAFELMDIILANTFENPLSSDAANMSHKLGMGEAAILFLGAFQYDAIVKSNPDVKLALMPIPHPYDGSKATMEVTVQNPVFIASKNQHPEESKEVLKWFTSEEGARIMSEEAGLPTAMDWNVDVELSPLSQDSVKYVQTGAPTVDFMNMFWPAGMTTEAGKTLQNYISGTIDKEGFFTAMDQAFVNLSKQ